MTRRVRAIPRGLVGMLALVAAIERGAIRDNLNLINARGESWSQTGRQLPRAVADCDLLCFGDSMVKCGLLPRALKERTGRPAFNLAVVGGSTASSYFLLRRAIEAGARPSTIVVDFVGDLIRFGPGSKERPYPWAHLLDTRESVELCWSARDPDLFVEITLARLVPSIRARYEIRTFLRERVNGELPDHDRVALLLYRNWNFNAGAMIDPKRSFHDDYPPPGAARLPGTWRPDPANVEYFHKFAQLTVKHKIEVVWLLPPVSPGTQDTWEYRGDEGRFEVFIRDALRRYPNVVVLDGRRSGYEATVFHDHVHLDRDGALALSDGVAEALRAGVADRVGPSRWVALPRYRRPATEVPLEDLRQSFASVEPIYQKRKGTRR